MSKQQATGSPEADLSWQHAGKRRRSASATPAVGTETSAVEDKRSFPLADLPEDALTCVLGKLPLGQLLVASTASRQLARASEAVFQDICSAERWAAPRRPRGAAAVTKHFPWRALYSRHACVACGGQGELFPVRQWSSFKVGGALMYLVCKKCAGQDRVKDRLVANNLYIDLLSLRGARLLSRKQVKRDLGLD
ncbi:hypothetical protein WJX81_002368 [Elliptochloris bilobata]|uniref:F-box domain-containing protein n=1 Tax=Elliptochloris bilobata TaxID=381761 RepID=A0AAW1S836_9CHLO